VLKGLHAQSIASSACLVSNFFSLTIHADFFESLSSWGGSRLHLGLQPQPASEKRPQPQPAKPAAFEIQPTVQKSASRMPFGRNSSGNLFTTDPGATFLSSGSDARDNSVRGRGRIATPRASSHRGVLNIRQFQMSKILFL
jgi:hypothetical protein